MSFDNQRLLEICKNVNLEKDTNRLAILIRELTEELKQLGTKKPPEAATTKQTANRISSVN